MSCSEIAFLSHRRPSFQTGNHDGLGTRPPVRSSSIRNPCETKKYALSEFPMAELQVMLQVDNIHFAPLGIDKTL